MATTLSPEDQAKIDQMLAQARMVYESIIEADPPRALAESIGRKTPFEKLTNPELKAACVIVKKLEGKMIAAEQGIAAAAAAAAPTKPAAPAPSEIPAATSPAAPAAAAAKLPPPGGSAARQRPPRSRNGAPAAAGPAPASVAPANPAGSSTNET